MTLEQMIPIIRERFGEVLELHIECHKNFVLARFLNANKVNVEFVHHDSPGRHNLPVWEVGMSYRDRVRFCGEGHTLNEAFAMIRDRKMERLLDLAMIDVPICKTGAQDA